MGWTIVSYLEFSGQELAEDGRLGPENEAVNLEFLASADEGEV